MQYQVSTAWIGTKNKNSSCLLRSRKNEGRTSRLVILSVVLVVLHTYSYTVLYCGVLLYFIYCETRTPTILQDTAFDNTINTVVITLELLLAL